MQYTRRRFLGTAAAGLTGAALFNQLSAFAQDEGLRLSACDWSLRAVGPQGINVAEKVGLDGLEVSAVDDGDNVKVADPHYREAYKEKVADTGVVVSSLAMGFLNQKPFATDSRAPQWLEQTIDATADLSAQVILLAFFGKGDLRNEGELKANDVDATVEILKSLAPRAEEKGVILGLENTLSGADNLAILDRVQSDSVLIYYDVKNSTNNGYDVPVEIRDLGDRICQIHFKNGKNYLGEEGLEMDPIAESIKAIDYKGWIVLETSVPSGDRDADFIRNAAFARELMGMA